MTTTDSCVPVRMPDPAVRERAATGVNGFVGLLAGVILLAVGAMLAEAGRLPRDAKPPRPRGRPRSEAD
ncbi:MULTISPECIES: hypothetical protein [unclassified Pseudonocardia]|jgi:hypothetical protein|uniref:hypothetical protein n=1 Tax=unclassified Pseudonocardia TaxID=2619320 RepID=UPI00096755E3|nr:MULTISPECIES: hypothetical protein [unclassified Pseudonocardia]MBN9099174.1 hypothetical protein [Pseudonocardia sp.]OJY46900.1 MAG: hypothetical protein BGP03_27675 [Pseudonocardia sp. 73-21]